MELTAERVEDIVKTCLNEEAELFVAAEGIMNKFGFDRARIVEHRDAIRELLLELPVEFRKESGGGWSFLNACNDRHGRQWTGMHRAMDQLFALGMAAGYVRCQLPRDMWSSLPGGMPYYVIDTAGEMPSGMTMAEIRAQQAS